MIRNWLLSWPRGSKRILQLCADLILVWFSLWLAFVIRIGWDDTCKHILDYKWLFIVAPIIAFPIFIKLGMYRAVMRFIGKEALTAIAKAVTISALVLALVIYWYRDVPASVPRSLIFNYWWLSLLFIGGLRLVMRHYFLGDWLEVVHGPFYSNGGGKAFPRVAVYGAGAAGNQLVTALRMGRMMEPVAFVDDNEDITEATIAGLKVYRPEQLQEMIDETKATQLLLAIPSATRSRRQEILAMLAPYPLHVRTIPGFMDLASGRVKVQDLQEVDIADLLGRDPVAPHQALFDRCIRSKSVMVTGAGGSIGSELCRQILVSGATRLILFEHSEFNLYSITTELQRHIAREGLVIELIPILGSIRNPVRLFEVMETWEVETVYHAAAYKHVPIVETNTTEGVLNNLFGTLHTAQSAVKAGVENFVLISTDKAVRPTNVMGATKRLAELVLQALSSEKEVPLFGEGGKVFENNTRFTMVRFGNVLGSSGSVIPLFRKQIQDGGPVTVTHPEITRYFMTIPEAAELVIQAGSLGEGGDVFVLDMGEPVKIADLAEKMINLTGLTVKSDKNPTGDIAIKFTGLRPGEKLYEELLIGDDVIDTEHEMIMRANESMISWKELGDLLAKLDAAVKAENCAIIRDLLLRYVAGYKPQGDIVDHLYAKKHID